MNDWIETGCSLTSPVPLMPWPAANEPAAGAVTNRESWLVPQASPHFPRDIKEAGSPRAIQERIVEPA
jgi:hypothetical protein